MPLPCESFNKEPIFNVFKFILALDFTKIYMILGLFLEMKFKKFVFIEMNYALGSIVIILSFAAGSVVKFTYYEKHT